MSLAEKIKFHVSPQGVFWAALHHTILLSAVLKNNCKMSREYRILREEASQISQALLVTLLQQGDLQHFVPVSLFILRYKVQGSCFVRSLSSTAKCLVAKTPPTPGSSSEPCGTSSHEFYKYSHDVKWYSFKTLLEFKSQYHEKNKKH
jgi:hypothetical protein